MIADTCTLMIDSTNQHHVEFISKLTARKPAPCIRLLTTNFDTLFEQAAKKKRFTIIDGFTFSHLRVFGGTNFDYNIVYQSVLVSSLMKVLLPMSFGCTEYMAVLIGSVIRMVRLF